MTYQIFIDPTTEVIVHVEEAHNEIQCLSTVMCGPLSDRLLLARSNTHNEDFTLLLGETYVYQCPRW